MSARTPVLALQPIRPPRQVTLVVPLPAKLVAASAVPALSGWVAVVAQVAAPDAGSSSLVVSGVSATLASGALAYVARQFSAGNLVHRNSAKAETELTKLVEAMTELIKDAHRREDVFHQLLLGRSGPDVINRGDR